MQIITETHSITVSSEPHGAVLIILSALFENEADSAAVLTNGAAYQLVEHFNPSHRFYVEGEVFPEYQPIGTGDWLVYGVVYEPGVHFVFIGDNGQRTETRLTDEQAQLLGAEIERLSDIGIDEFTE